MGCKGEKLDTAEMKVVLKVNGVQIDMVPFVHDSFRDMIIAFINNLKGHDGGKIEITIDK
ncbi:MAG: hypothetical protein JW996_05910 [Candidatus Cloacimonetes bacterium]|nr:hypothetical protein [Candidatus Cloacimonadota bacterium]